MESERIVLERIDFLKLNCEIMKQLVPASVKVKEQNKRWGSCTAQKNIYINSKISMARLDVIDYVIIHEFSHLVHMNHSKKFYDLVKSIMPDYKDKENWLKINGYKIIIVKYKRSIIVKKINNLKILKKVIDIVNDREYNLY